MSAIIKNIVVGPLRFAARQILQRPGLKKRVRAMIMRMPRVYGLLMRLMFHTPAPARRKLAIDQGQLSPDAQRVQRALKQALHTRR